MATSQLQTCLWYKANVNVDQDKFSALNGAWHFENCTAFHEDVIFLNKSTDTVAYSSNPYKVLIIVLTC